MNIQQYETVSQQHKMTLKTALNDNSTALNVTKTTRFGTQPTQNDIIAALNDINRS